MLSADSDDGSWSVGTLGCRWARGQGGFPRPPPTGIAHSLGSGPGIAWLSATTKAVLESGSREVGPHEPDPLVFCGTKSEAWSKR